MAGLICAYSSFPGLFGLAQTLGLCSASWLAACPRARVPLSFLDWGRVCSNLLKCDSALGLQNVSGSAAWSVAQR